MRFACPAIDSDEEALVITARIGAFVAWQKRVDGQGGCGEYCAEPPITSRHLAHDMRLSLLTWCAPVHTLNTASRQERKRALSLTRMAAAGP